MRAARSYLGLGLALGVGAVSAAAPPLVLEARDFGVKADGVRDDGPAIARMLAAAEKAGVPVRLQFPAHKTIRVASAPERYVFRFRRASHRTLDGGGCTFLLAPRLRFLRVRHSRCVTIRNLNVDFDPLPFVDGTVSAVNPGARCIQVRLSDGQRKSLLAGGPTKEDGEQAFFGMLWHGGAYGLVSRHCWIERMEKARQPNAIRVFTTDRFTQFGDIVPGKWRISLPVPGIAHCCGPGPCFDIRDNDTVTVEDVELWSAPWMGFAVIRNRGAITFRRVAIRPKPGSGRLTSTWRDGFHVKGNRGKLLWEDCVLAGMNDDAFNIATHCSRVRKVLSPTELIVLQTFPLNPMPWRAGARLAAADFDSRVLLGSARVVGVHGWTTERRLNGKPAASPVTIEIDRPITGLAAGSIVWDSDSANPDTTLRRCRIEMSCRLQCPVRLEKCDVTGLLWFYSERVEGPFPSNVLVRDCRLRRGRGNSQFAVVFSGRRPGWSGPAAIHDVTIENNRIWGGVKIAGVDRLRWTGNRLLEPGAPLRIVNCREVDFRKD